MQFERTRTGIRVGIERAALSHVPALYRAINRSRDHLKHLAWAASIDEAGVAKHVNSIDWKTKALWAICTEEGPIGCIEFRQKFGQKGDYYEIGYWLSKDFVCQGVMTTAVGIALMTLCIGDHVKAHLRASNKASQGVLLKTGFYETARDVVDGEDWITYGRVVGYRGPPWL